MYTPRLFSDNIFKLWNSTDEDAENGRNRNGNGMNIHNGPSMQEQNENDRKSVRLLFAPPLLAYSAEMPGASLLQLEYTIRTRCGNQEEMPFLTPNVQRKLDKMRQIRYTGYRKFLPIGLNQTMEEMAIKRELGAKDTEESYSHTAENVDRVPNSSVDGIGGIQQEETSNGGVEGEGVAEVDLDDDIPDVDEQDSLEDEDDYGRAGEEPREENIGYVEINEDEFNEDEGFMAADVEYQNDHGISNEYNSPNVLINSGSTTTTMSNFNSGRSSVTNPTSIGSRFSHGALANPNMSAVISTGLRHNSNQSFGYDAGSEDISNDDMILEDH